MKNDFYDKPRAKLNVLVMRKTNENRGDENETAAVTRN